MRPTYDPRRCESCAMHRRLCICQLIPRVESRTRLALVIHQRERRKPTNSGGLAARCLVSSVTHVTGLQDAPLDYASVPCEGMTNLFLFPAEGATVLTRDFAATLTGPVQLIVPDGNWRQASKVRKKMPASVPIVDVTLPVDAPSRYELRREAKGRPEGLATLEAIARAFAILDGPHVSEPILEVFRVMVSRTLWTRGKVPAGEVYGGLPPQ